MFSLMQCSATQGVLLAFPQSTCGDSASLQIVTSWRPGMTRAVAPTPLLGLGTYIPHGYLSDVGQLLSDASQYHDAF